MAGRSGRYGGPPGDLVVGRAEQCDPRSLDHRRRRRAGVPPIRQPDVPGRLRSAAGRRTRGRARRHRSRRDSGVLQGRRDAAAHRRSRDGRVGRVGAVPRPTHESIRRRGAEGDRSLGAEAPARTGGAGRTSRRAARRLDRNGARDQGLRRSVRPTGRSRGRRCLPARRCSPDRRYDARLPSGDPRASRGRRGRRVVPRHLDTRSLAPGDARDGRYGGTRSGTRPRRCRHGPLARTARGEPGRRTGRDGSSLPFRSRRARAVRGHPGPRHDRRHLAVHDGGRRGPCDLRRDRVRRSPLSGGGRVDRPA